ncbi:MAG: polyhydroxyalkanoate synthesis repressor PhaR [bacterium]|nr:polyhydroxyalkanoate synthesis repressor PhaR [bacterium]
MTQKSTRGRAAKAPAPPKRRRGRPTRQETKQREAAYAQFEGQRVIHRYGNRRFYDLEARRAITLDEIAELVRKGEEVRVLDVEGNNEDITRRVLTQIILEAKSHNNLEMLPVEFLRKLISTQDEKTATWLDGFLKAGAALLDRSVREGMELSNTYHKQLADLMQGVVPRSWGVPPKREEAASASRSEIDELRRRLDELAKGAAAKTR